MTSRAVKALTFAAAATVTSVFFINFCATIFQCGCLSLWNGADAHCTVHIHGMRPCPWCRYGVVASTIPYAIMVAVQAGVSFWPRAMPAMVRVAVAVAAFPAVGAILAGIYGWAAGYWK